MDAQVQELAGGTAPQVATPGALPVTLSANAAKRIRTIVEAEANPALKLRVSVSGGGCSGFQYGFTLDDAVTGDDLLIERDGATLVLDQISADYMRGSEIDFVEDLSGAGFQIRNPLATSSCGCGNSFAV
ncbi:iron-sulfur cluster insertion protein ErpA [Ferrovibrio sp. MS7]|jgi:iron-sulfur cluster insertion protein|uniref:iron-sulfur cluster insertion protein ErpA n=1 Tax=Ferrovibrio TaxID=1231242 RepID=UPI001B702121|nr:iron-sulfur cluster insertion protein ErpA [Ferrovibrio sp.]